MAISCRVQPRAGPRPDPVRYPWTVMGRAGSTLLIMLQARLEEQHLLALHGEAYRRYASAAGRFLPGLGRLASPPQGA